MPMIKKMKVGGKEYDVGVPSPQQADKAKFLRGDYTWAVPPDTTYDIIDTDAIADGEPSDAPSVISTEALALAMRMWGRMEKQSSGSGAIAATLNPNIHYEFGAVSSLDITLGDPLTGTNVLAFNEYSFEFDSGATAATLSVPSSVVWAEEPAIEANTHYEVNIHLNYKNNKYYGLITGWGAQT